MPSDEAKKNNPEGDSQEKKPGKEKKKEGFFDSLVVAVVIALIIKAFIVQTYTIPSGSMLDTLLIGDYILVNRLAYKFSEPDNGDVIVFEYPLEPEKSFIKRIIAKPGDRIKIVDKQVFLNGEALQEDYKQIKDKNVYPDVMSNRDNIDPFTVPDNKYFVMGDNRDASYDGRFWGFIDKDSIKGKAFLIYWSLKTPEYGSAWSKMPLRFFRFLNPEYDRFDRILKLIH
ncbi:signal peptidase I [Limisalsivibrio acetivorans]|uniref:signal peptidase I n=1 Tax=Limisalsivibrio acetivorans TaxID=1304888 RepID=UPI0003B4D11D|nr:signal peptidase I [Limisalsivibrio acetivorans]